MIDFQDMKNRQQQGLAAIDSLQEEERVILQHYCSLATEAMLKMGDQRKSSVDQVVINSYRYGIALGLRLKISEGEIQGRS